MPHGIEVDLLRDGRLLTTRAFDTGDEALAWAEAKRLARSTAGWTSTS